MPHYLIAAHGSTEPPQSDAAPPPPMTDEEMTEMTERVLALEEDMKEAGAWVFGGALHPPDTATVVRDHAGDAVTTDGPFVESKDFLAGIYLVEAPDLDGAVEWARRTSALVGAPLEVRPFQDRPEG